MNEPRFERWARALSGPASRRQTILASILGGLTLLRGGHEATAKKRKKKNIKKNDFGCVNVGGLCKNKGQCCSGICKGKKGRKRCKAHDTGGCTGEQDTCAGVLVPCKTATGEDGACARTTGNAGYCNGGGFCFPCRRDADCHARCGPQAACIVCETECGPNGTACVGRSEGDCSFA
jgi:hypothetical protein